jgi:hypothetical protein
MPAKATARTSIGDYKGGLPILARGDRDPISGAMQHLDLTDEEHAALLRLVRKALDTDRYPLSPRLYPLRSILEKLEPSAPQGAETSS